MSGNRNTRHTHTSRRRQSSPAPGRKRAAAGKLRPDKAKREILALVRSGVERFILKNATVEDFFRTIQAISENEKVYSHQLTKSVFSKIVKEAVRKRNLRRSKEA